ncbi:MAG TPA: SRPBCC family protein [Methylomirabilota bacterium]|jgi:hypothetical protein
MRIEQKFIVDAAPDRVWALLTDPFRVARCLPGASITEKIDDKTYGGTITVKVGPIAASYRGRLTFERLDDARREAELVASGQDVRGRGGADMRLSSRVMALEGGAATQVLLESDVTVHGLLGQMGRGMIETVASQMLEQFTAAVRENLAAESAAAPAPEAAPALNALSIGTDGLKRAARRVIDRVRGSST